MAALLHHPVPPDDLGQAGEIIRCLGISLLQGLVFGFLAAWVGLLGDLIASAIKRDAGIKDSSRILPGLGGLIDTLDSLLVAGPLAWWLLG